MCVFCAAQSASAQSVQGTVRDAEGRALPGVHVSLPELNRGVVTNEEGQYLVDDLPVGEYLFSFSYLGFEDQPVPVQVGENSVVHDVVMVPEILEAREVVISEDRVNSLTRDKRSISVLDAAELMELRGETLGETLENLAGVTTLTTGPSISKPVVRGLHSQRVLILNAGVAQEGQQWGGDHAPEIDPFAPVQIQVIKGVSGVEYGLGAIGGVVRLDPLDLPYYPDEKVKGSFSMNGFSNNVQGAGSLYLEGVLNRIPGLGWRVQSSYRKAGDSKTPDYLINNSAFKEFNGSASVGLQRDRLNMVALYSRFSTELGIFSGAHIGNSSDILRAIERGRPSFEGDFGYEIQSPKQEITHNLVSLHGDYRLESGSWIEAQYGFQVNHRQEFDAHSRSSDPLATERAAFDLSLITNTLELKFHRKPRNGFFGVAGVSGMNQLNKNGATGFLIPNFRAFTGGLFARESWVRGDLTIEAGVRFDYRWIRAWPRENGSRGAFVKRITDFASFSGVVGSIWQFAPNWSLGVNLGSGWRPPGVNELYTFGVHHGTAQFVRGSTSLGSERSIGLDVTLRHESEDTKLEFSAYNNEFNGFIFLFPEQEPRVTIRGTFPAFEYLQADARLRGFESVLEQDVTSWLTLIAQVSVVRGDNLDTDEPLINMPSDRGSLKTRFNLPTGSLMKDAHFDLEGIFVQRQKRVPQNADYAPPPDAYALINASFSTTFALSSPVRLSLELHNAFNTAYRDYLSRFRYFTDEPGRSLILRLQVPIGRQ